MINHCLVDAVFGGAFAGITFYVGWRNGYRDALRGMANSKQGERDART